MTKFTKKIIAPLKAILSTEIFCTLEVDVDPTSRSDFPFWKSRYLSLEELPIQIRNRISKLMNATIGEQLSDVGEKSSNTEYWLYIEKEDVDDITRTFIPDGLSVDQASFLSSYNIPITRIFNATGMPTWRYKELMKDELKWVAYGVTRCLVGHTLRTRAGHCAQCKTDSLGFLRRHDEEGSVYIAESRSGGLIKIGCSKNPSSRILSLNKSCYAQCSDWELIRSVTIKEAGRIESEIQISLKKYQVYGIYYINGDTERECMEVFRCTPRIALDAFKIALK